VPGPLDFARKLTQDLLVANPAKGSIAGVWAGWDEPAMGAVQAAIAAGRTEIKVVGIDGTPFARAEIAKKGPFLASVAQDFDAMAAKVAELIEGTLDGKRPSEQLYRLPGKLVAQ
jgi:ribose transport system substrate-binding protein